MALAAALQSAPQPQVEVEDKTVRLEDDGSVQGHSECGSMIAYPNPLSPKIKTREGLKRELGYNGTFGDFEEDLILTEDPDSDLPEELNDILKRGSHLTVEDTFLYSEGSPLGRAIGSPSELTHEQASNPSVTKKSSVPSASLRPGLPPVIPVPPIATSLCPSLGYSSQTIKTAKLLWLAQNLALRIHPLITKRRRVSISLGRSSN